MKNHIKVSAAPNKAQRTFTLRKYVNGKPHSKYRTDKVSREEFERLKKNTSSDWAEFLKSKF